MAFYDYKCTNEKCPKKDQEVTVSKPMGEASTEELCVACNKTLQKIYGSPGISTSDGWKS